MSSKDYTGGMEIADDVDAAHQPSRNSSSIGAYFNIICVIAGTGTLQLPLAMHQSGWFGVFLIVLSALMAIYTGNLLIRCLYVYPGRRLTGYGDIGDAAFGRPGRWVVMFFNYAILLGASCIYIMLVGSNTYSLLAASNMGSPLSERAWIAVAGVVVLLPVLAVKTLKEAAILSAFGTIATVVVVVVSATLSGLELARPDHVPARHAFINPSQLAIALASISFSFGGNVVYPHVEATMRHPKSWPRVLTAAIASTCVMYFIICVPAYLAYGDKIQSPIFHSLPQGAATTSAIILITIHVLLAAPILITSFALDIESRLSVSVARLGRFKEFIYRASIRTTSVALLTVVAMVVPFFGDFMALLGALANCMIVFVLPIVCYLRLFGWRSVWKITLAWCFLIVAIGLFACVLGAIDAIKALHDDFAGRR
ncbi:transmembrane amino acid transporter protein-domain-containing protein [Syncephalis pseudoplumigaleata]|uniref:Transmembrane amino acid transporter protein-domain-containing protein n=1 Tax=Syncephalis pseudoplumigaleata TaxID=1712513 RepID=A0A4P9Z0U5_9FUNG|nr:transmembrane amino acid transporter protein-domain-containing protein [Syncephalis pseudoplumigaleata]|eukprot:RKP26024.1 transmembrane amino acid transporter protein-domain-containing protein [Syncephalis pseudoplumigaleata]